MFLLLKIVVFGNKFPNVGILCVLVLLKSKYNGSVGMLDQ